MENDFWSILWNFWSILWNELDKISAAIGIVSAFVTIIAAFKTKKYAKSIMQAYMAESLVIAEEKLEQAKEKFLDLRKLKFGNTRGASTSKTQEMLSNIESLLDEAEKKTPTEKEFLRNSINECKKTLCKCVADTTIEKNFLYLGTDIDNARKQFQNEISNEREETINNIK